MTTNLSRAQSVVHDRGPLWLWVRTSCAIPGLAPPVPHDGDLLVDGGLLNNLPADVMRERCGTVIGVDVTAGVDLRWHGESRPSLSGWALLRERWSSGGGPPFPTIVEILERTALAACIRDAASMRAECDVCITPAVEAYGMSSFTDIDAIIRAGAEAAAEALDGWHLTPPR
jgi:predicted acylesterase/phospholipase RssA